MSDRPTVLVLGVGGNVSQGIQKALALGPTPWRVVAACVTPSAAGLALAERAYLSPWANDPGFVDWVIATANAERAVAVLSGVEAVVDALAAGRDRILAESGATAIVAGESALAVGRDKLRTARWLAENGLDAPLSASAGDVEAVRAIVDAAGWPVVVKPRVGGGGAGVFVIGDWTSLEPFMGRDEVVVQQHLGTEDDEYTVGCVSDRDGRLVGSAVLHRHLAAGTTVLARAVRAPHVRFAAEEIVRRLAPAGPCNVQLRVHEGRPIAFELNVRFSGTTPMRARLGFADVEALTRHFAFGEPVPQLPAELTGTVVRYYNEVIMDDDGVQPGLDTPLDGPRGVVENWGMGR